MFCAHVEYYYFIFRTFKDLKDYVVSMKGEKNTDSEDGNVDETPKVVLLDTKNFEDSIKTGKS